MKPHEERVLRQSGFAVVLSAAIGASLVLCSLLAGGGKVSTEVLVMLFASIGFGAFLVWTSWPIAIVLRMNEMEIRRRWRRKPIEYRQVREAAIRLRPGGRSTTILIEIMHVDPEDGRKRKAVRFPLKSFRKNDISALVEQLADSAPDIRWDDDLMAYHRVEQPDDPSSPNAGGSI